MAVNGESLIGEKSHVLLGSAKTRRLDADRVPCRFQRRKHEVSLGVRGSCPCQAGIDLNCYDLCSGKNRPRGIGHGPDDAPKSLRQGRDAERQKTKKEQAELLPHANTLLSRRTIDIRRGRWWLLMQLTDAPRFHAPSRSRPTRFSQPLLTFSGAHHV